MELLVALVVVGVIVLMLSASSVRLLRDDERLVVFRLGRHLGVMGPGRVFVLPIIDKG